MRLAALALVVFMVLGGCSQAPPPVASPSPSPSEPPAPSVPVAFDDEFTYETGATRAHYPSEAAWILRSQDDAGLFMSIHGWPLPLPSIGDPPEPRRDWETGFMLFYYPPLTVVETDPIDVEEVRAGDGDIHVRVSNLEPCDSPCSRTTEVRQHVAAASIEHPGEGAVFVCHEFDEGRCNADFLVASEYHSGLRPVLDGISGTPFSAFDAVGAAEDWLDAHADEADLLTVSSLGGDADGGADTWRVLWLRLFDSTVVQLNIGPGGSMTGSTGPALRGNVSVLPDDGRGLRNSTEAAEDARKAGWGVGDHVVWTLRAGADEPKWVATWEAEGGSRGILNASTGQPDGALDENPWIAFEDTRHDAEQVAAGWDGSWVLVAAFMEDTSTAGFVTASGSAWYESLGWAESDFATGDGLASWWAYRFLEPERDVLRSVTVFADRRIAAGVEMPVPEWWSSGEPPYYPDEGLGHVVGLRGLMDEVYSWDPPPVRHELGWTLREGETNPQAVWKFQHCIADYCHVEVRDARTGEEV